jgi:hypothetical protein
MSKPGNGTNKQVNFSFRSFATFPTAYFKNIGLILSDGMANRNTTAGGTSTTSTSTSRTAT